MKIQEIVDEVNKLTSIELRETDFLGKGQNADVYRYMIKNNSIAVKCFQDQDDA